MPRKIDAGELLALIGGALVLVALFLDWFESLSAWQSFEIADFVMAVLALAAIAAATAGLRERAVVDALDGHALPWLGAALVAVVTLQLIDPPRPFAEAGLETGAWLALAGASAVLLGGAMRVARVSVSVSIGGRDARHRVAAVDRRSSAPPAPPTAPTTPASAPHDPERTETFPATRES